MITSRDRRTRRTAIAISAVVLALFCLIGTARAQTCERQIRDILGNSAKYWGVYVASLRSGTDLAAVNADKPLIVASNKKIMTTAAALDLLGPGYQFVTKVCRNGPVENGVLRGDLVIIGGGDPNISGRYYDGDPLAIPTQWAKAVRAAGITSIEGGVIADDTLFDRTLVHPSWPANQLLWWYCAPVCGLAFNDNCVDLSVLPGNAGGAARVTLDPPTKYLSIANSCTTTSSKAAHSIRIDRKPGERLLRVSGKCWSKAPKNTSTVTVDDPALFLATVVREQLAREGVTVAGAPKLAPRDGDLGEMTEICRTTSDLATTMVVTNKRSQNMYAEQIHKLMGAVIEGDGSFEGGNKALAGFMAKLGIKAEDYTSADGSGMSRDNRFTARQMGTVLKYMADHPATDVFIASMAVAGRDGTLKSRWNSKALNDRVRAKTGYIRGVRTLSGYITDASGEPRMVFSFLINGPSNKEAQRKILELLVKTAGVAP